MTYEHEVSFRLNGEAVTARVASDETLLDALRRCFHCYGSRESCGQGLCGTCTVVVDGRVVSSCIMLARLSGGSDIETIEGLGKPGALSDVQQAFVREVGFQCGFCTPGMVLTATQLLRQNPDPTDDEIRHYLAGNICRCGAYPEILRAVRSAAEHRRSEPPGEDDGARAAG
jgi:aerobic-type carbon monoxide dehydrogenase small subunit (CoxS/CutS family)